jgi:hypothetical protein
MSPRWREEGLEEKTGLKSGLGAAATRRPQIARPRTGGEGKAASPEAAFFTPD